MDGRLHPDADDYATLQAVDHLRRIFGGLPTEGAQNLIDGTRDFVERIRVQCCDDFSVTRRPTRDAQCSVAAAFING